MATKRKHHEVTLKVKYEALKVTVTAVFRFSYFCNIVIEGDMNVSDKKKFVYISLSYPVQYFLSSRNIIPCKLFSK